VRFGVGQAGYYLCGYLKPRLDLWFPIHREFAFDAKKVILQPLDFVFPPRSLFRNSLPGFESNRVVKEWHLLTRESESSKALLSAPVSNRSGTKARAALPESSERREYIFLDGWAV
jgi:hypothetical protein